MTDAGSDLNLIKENAIGPNTPINRERIYQITGIGDGIFETLEEINIRIEKNRIPLSIISH